MLDDRVKKNYAPKNFKINYCLSGFTLQLNSRNTSKISKTIVNIVHELLIQLNLRPLDCSLQEELLNVCIEPINTNVDREKVNVVKKAWEVIYAIYREISDVNYVEPKFDFIVPVENTGGCCVTRDTQSKKNEQDDRIKHDPEWHLKQMQVISAWSNYFDNDSSKAGQGIVIGHPDTGYLYHPELPTQIAALGLPEGIKIGDNQPLRQSSDGEIEEAPSVWHGTATASLIISPRGFDSKPKENRGNPFVSGVAPGATLLPLKLGSSTQLRLPDYAYRLYSTNLANAINYAADTSDSKRSGRQGVDVLSISLGGYPNLSLRRAIINATKKGIIVIVSAGNGIPFVGWPAAYDSVIAVASSTIEGKRANHSARGSRVNIAAPGQGIYCAILLRNGQYAVQQRDGTSYAAPLVAGVAALWLSHRRQELDEKYADDPAKIPLAFAKLLHQTCTPWNEENCGPGIVNANELLKADLPDSNDPDLLIPPVLQYDENLALDQGGVVTFRHLFEATLSHPEVIHQISSRKLDDPEFLKEIGMLGTMEWTLGKLVGHSGRELRSFLSVFGRELSFLFGTNFELYNLFVDALHAEKIEEFLPTVKAKLLECVSTDLREELLKSS